MKRIFFLLLIMTGCASAPLASWRVYDAGSFSFSMPASLQKNDVHGIDSYVCEFTNEDMTLSFDFGMYSGIRQDSLKKEANYRFHTENIAGHNVQIISFDGAEADGFRFKHVIGAIFLGAGLTMKAECKESSNYVEAERIFRSVRFK